jgi:parallel beta-helix repeat protein
VIQVEADGITIEFQKGSVLRGAATGTGTGQTAWDQLKGCGVRINGHKNVTLKNVEVAGFRVGVRATSADGLKIEDGSIHDCFRQHLKSSPQAEDGADWLWPHANDKNEWVTNYGAAACIERSSGVTVHNLTVRRSQNGVILDRVDHASIYDNDCSFLSGWGLAMWRSCDNTIARNAFDFCVRGHSEGVYNRGQDSAGILCFEQCSRNTFNENSVTHDGDGFFGFAGKEAIGEAPPPGAFDYAEAGCNGNSITNNDFSYCPAHGLELTFSHGNKILSNRFTENAICGIWGGYSTHTLIEGNSFENNGGMSYGAERGGVNIEHGSFNEIVRNTFKNNRCAVHLWWDDDGKLLALPGVKAHGDGEVTGNLIARNTITIDGTHQFKDSRDKGPLIGLQLRDPTGGKHVSKNVYAGNTVTISDPRGQELDIAKGCEPATDFNGTAAGSAHPRSNIGTKTPVGARDALAGRAAIVMDEWGPWDHVSPLVRRTQVKDGDLYEVMGAKNVEYHARSIGTKISPGDADGQVAARFTISPIADLVPYTINIITDGQSREFSGTLLHTEWDVLVFPWTHDPRTDHQAWLDESQSKGLQLRWQNHLDLPLSRGGPRMIPEWADHKDQLPGADHYGMIASAYIKIPSGKWRISTLSDDGIKVEVIWERRKDVPRKTAIDNMTWHAPTRDTGVFEQDRSNEPIQIRVEYFQIDGAAALSLDLTPAD